MELDDLKHIFREQPITGKSPAEIAAVMHAKSNSVIQKIRRSIRLEIGCAIFFTIAGIAWFLSSSLLFYKALAVYVIIFCIGFLFYITRLIKKINVYQTITQSVKKNLELIIQILQSFIRLYFRLTMLMLPVICLIGLLTINPDRATSLSTLGWLFYFAWFIGWAVFMYYFTKWYLRKLYGNYLQELKQLLSDLNAS